MKRTLYLLLASVILVGFTTSTAAAQSLGEQARQLRAQKKPTTAKVFTNDDLGSLSSTPINVVGAGGAVAAADAKAEATADTKAAAPADKGKANEKMVGQMDDLKKEIATLEHDIDIMQREYRLRAATYYADAGNALRDPKAWADAERQYQADLKAKQDALTADKQKLADMQEAARKAGLPPGQIQ